MLLIARESLLFWRAAVFLWIIFLSAIESILLWALVYVVVAIFLSPASIALRTFLIMVRSSDLKDALCELRFSV